MTELPFGPLILAECKKKMVVGMVLMVVVSASARLSIQLGVVVTV